MNYIYLMGGLGNQIFQYFFSIYLANLTRQRSFLVVDWYQTNTQRKLLLQKLVRNAEFVSLSKLIESGLEVKPTKSEYVNPRSNCYIGHYISDEFTPSPQDIFNLFNLNTVLNDKCVLHVRGGDFLGLGSGLEVNYYERAIQLIPSNLQIEVVTDDLPFALSLLASPVIQSRNLVYSEIQDEITDFVLLASAKYVVCANSTFSLAAAMYASSLGGICICPPPIDYFNGVSVTDSRVSNLSSLMSKHKLRAAF